MQSASELWEAGEAPQDGNRGLPAVQAYLQHDSPGLYFAQPSFYTTSSRSQCKVHLPFLLEEELSAAADSSDHGSGLTRAVLPP